MALAQTNPSGPLNRAFSVGPVKVQVVNVTAASGDTGGTVTFDRLNTIDYVVCTVAKQTAAPSSSGNVATIAFADPVATIAFQVIAYGR